MAGDIRIWYDAEGDFLEVLLSDKPGFMRQTNHDAVMERVDQNGRLLGFSIMNISRLRGQHPLTANLSAARPEQDAA